MPKVIDLRPPQPPVTLVYTDEHARALVHHCARLGITPDEAAGVLLIILQASEEEAFKAGRALGAKMAAEGKSMDEIMRAISLDVGTAVRS
jgi:hypothetical protein